MFNLNTLMILDIVFYIFVAIVLIQLFYYLGIFSRFAFAKKQQNTPRNIPVSVLVCAKNEEENVKRLIPLLLNQAYPNFEIVLINDASSDNTLEVFKEYAALHNSIKIVDVINNEAFWGNKKYALTLGIKAAKNEFLLFTDADCYPTSEQWISEMTSGFSKTKTIVLGYGAYEKVKNSLLNKLIRFETCLTAIQYFGWAKSGNPYMGIGRNMAYKREEFFKTNGFINHMKIRSGDDDLFINEAANSKNTSICYSQESFTYSEPKKNFRDWIRQKRRHVSTAGHYKFIDKAQLALFYISQSWFILLALFLAIIGYDWIYLVSLIGFRYLVTWLVFGFSANKLKEKDTIYLYPILEIMLIFIQLNVFVSNMFSKPVHWK